MKITKTQLEKIIREELALAKEVSMDPAYLAQRAKDADKPVPSSGGATSSEHYVNQIKDLLGDALQGDSDNVRDALEVLRREIDDTHRGAMRENSPMVKEGWVDQLYNALYALEDNVEGVVVDTELEQVYRKLHSMLKAHILEKSKTRDAARQGNKV